MKAPKIRAVKIPLEGFKAQWYVEIYQMWYDMPETPTFRTPESALFWAEEQLAEGWPK